MKYLSSLMVHTQTQRNTRYLYEVGRGGDDEFDRLLARSEETEDDPKLFDAGWIFYMKGRMSAIYKGLRAVKDGKIVPFHKNEKKPSNE